MTDAPGVVLRRGREGGRWLNERPTSVEFAEWFQASMPIDPKLRHEDYVGGVVLIPAVDSKAPYVTGFTDKGVPMIEQREELNYIPYAKVETRINYFWNLLEAHPEWCSVVEYVTSPRIPIDFITEEEVREGTERATIKRRQPGAMTVLTHQLPEGFSIISVPVGQGYTHFICCTIRVAIHRANDEGLPLGKPLRTGRGTKQVPLLAGRATPYADPNAAMKAETGAFGRALGFAGIFVIPGSGVATAEDMLEALTQEQTPAQPATGNAGPAAPTEPPVRTGAEQAAEDDETLRARAQALYAALSQEQPAKAEEFGQWARQRRLTSLGEAHGAILRGVVKKLERLSDREEGAHVPATPPAAEPGATPS
jgi:hypothetical protein